MMSRVPSVLAVVWLSLTLAPAPAGADRDPDVGAVPAGAVAVTTTTLSIPTYPFAAFLEWQHSTTYNMDYARLNWGAYEGSAPHAEPHSYVAVVVENAWLRLTFLPELGGRLYGVTDKVTGDELLYQNPVIKPTHWGPAEQGWWLAAGGIEWCLPVEEHGYEWGVPWSYSISTTGDGATVVLWDTAATDRVRARITVHLPADRAAFTLTPRLENPTGAPVTFKFWHNAMLAPGTDNTVGPKLRFVVPIDEVTVHSRGDDYLPGDGQAMSWPVYNGTDYSRLGNWNRWLGFFARPQAAADWAGVYAEGALRGVARVFPHQVAVGLKGFAFGWANPIGAGEWTDDDSAYVELHAGPAPTFWDAIGLPPGGALEWTETWLPVRDLPRLSLANAEAAIGLKAEGADLDVGAVLAAGSAGARLRLWRRTGCVPLWQADGLALAPGEAAAGHLAGLGSEAGDAVLGVLDGSRPVILSGDLDCPRPASQVDPLAGVQTATVFAVTWSAADPGRVVAGYDVQVRDGDTTAPWTDWLAGTPAGGAAFSGQNGHTYAFRSRARDIFGRVEPWPAAPWGDTFSTVLLEPAPVLITSEAAAWPSCVRSGDLATFQVTLNNTGSLPAALYVTDSLPGGLTLTAGPWISPPLPPPAVAGNTITWDGTLAAGQTGVAIGFEARVTAVAPGQVVENVVSIDDGLHPVLARRAAVRGCRRIYLPLVLRE